MEGCGAVNLEERERLEADIEELANRLRRKAEDRILLWRHGKLVALSLAFSFDRSFAVRPVAIRIIRKGR